MIQIMGTRGRFTSWGRYGLLVATGLLLSACVSRPPNTDLFGRPLTPGDSAQPAPLPAPPDSARPTRAAPTEIDADLPPPPVGGTGGVRQVEIPRSTAGGPTPAPAPLVSWTPTVVTPNARDVTTTSYVVAAGDTLRGIGNRTGAGSEAIAAANALEAPYTVRVGQRLIIPAGRYHEVLAGQSGIAIARAYSISWSALIEENGLVEPYVLRVGQRLRLPVNNAPTRPRTIEEQAQAFRLDIDGIMAGNQPAAPAAVPSTRPAPATNIETNPIGPGRFAWPLNGQLLQRFGPFGNGRVNNGIDIAAVPGTPVRATAAGVVSYAGTEIALFGGLILIDHGGGWTSAYAHLDQVSVTVGQSVRAGQVIATSGESGQVQQPQLHFELRRDRRPVDPMRHLPAR